MPVPSQTGKVFPLKRATEATTPIATPPAIFNKESAKQRSIFDPNSSSDRSAISKLQQINANHTRQIKYQRLNRPRTLPGKLKSSYSSQINY